MNGKTSNRIRICIFKSGCGTAFSLGKIIYVTMLLVAGTTYYMQSEKLFLPWYINNYLNDLLCIPLVLGVLSAGLRCFKDSTFKFPLSFIITLVLYYAVYFEYYLPQINPRYTGDCIDVLLYGLGGTVFYSYECLYK